MLAAIHDGKEKGANRNNSPAGWIRVLVESSAGSQRTHATGKSAQSRTILCDGFIISVVTSLRGFVSSQSTSNVSSFRVVLFVSKEGRGKGREEKKNWKIGPIKSRRGNERLELVGKRAWCSCVLRENRVETLQTRWSVYTFRGIFFNLLKYSTNYSLSFLFANGNVLGRDIY